ncbi:isochorismatase family protein [Curtobacterium sp. MCBD17_040]|uniref:isochorismatase family protein n=1 Tax=Curtobacterium sp. MCBD17_040 TaxID=2175674 RepID=UPI000DA9DEE9|nr:isochorismatase family protein [Curtobacterium sp. MCBD17_040]WIB65846.1 isochorismatase family protein [Curtobacterium sp. MCBD17_040]
MAAGLREVEDYQLPAGGDIPAPLVPWAVDPKRAALLVHDMQVYFLNAFASAPALRRELIENTRAVLVAARAAGVPVIYSAQPGSMTPEQRGLLVDLWGPGMQATEDERAVIAELAPTAEETVLTKWRYSAFHRSPLLDTLHNAGRDQLIITGIYAHLGVIATALDAYANDVQTFIVADATPTFSEAEHRQALDFAATSCAVVAGTADVVAGVTR